MEGVGIYKWSDGRSYTGEYIDDKKHGYGIYRWQDGRKYTGYWYFGKQHGLGIYAVATENREKHGLWEDGKRVEWFSPETQALINQNKYNWAQHFKTDESKASAVLTHSYLEPQDFYVKMNNLNLQLTELRKRSDE